MGTGNLSHPTEVEPPWDIERMAWRVIENETKRGAQRMFVKIYCYCIEFAEQITVYGCINYIKG